MWLWFIIVNWVIIVIMMTIYCSDNMEVIIFNNYDNFKNIFIIYESYCLIDCDNMMYRTSYSVKWREFFSGRKSESRMWTKETTFLRNSMNSKHNEYFRLHKLFEYYNCIEQSAQAITPRNYEPQSSAEVDTWAGT